MLVPLIMYPTGLKEDPKKDKCKEVQSRLYDYETKVVDCLIDFTGAETIAQRRTIFSSLVTAVSSYSMLNWRHYFLCRERGWRIFQEKDFKLSLECRRTKVRKRMCHIFHDLRILNSVCLIFTQERVVKIDEGERTRTSQRNVNLSLKKMVKVSRLLFSYFSWLLIRFYSDLSFFWLLKRVCSSLEDVRKWKVGGTLFRWG